MKKTLFLLACQLMWATCASAQSSYRLGYCPDELPADAQAYGVSGATNRLSAAICLPKSKMLRYKGGSVKAIRFAVKAEGLSSASVWLRSNLNERSRVVQSVGTMADGWNEVELRARSKSMVTTYTWATPWHKPKVQKAFFRQAQERNTPLLLLPTTSGKTCTASALMPC